MSRIGFRGGPFPVFLSDFAALPPGPKPGRINGLPTRPPATIDGKGTIYLSDYDGGIISKIRK